RTPCASGRRIWWSWGPGEAPSVRWALTHMIEETGRHAGHADVLRELLDGATGR
ncbi:DUF664 domain-containing protein, partial [Streptomyces sp. PAL114]|uniref:mycothiol transferase n=1 Tax=Streptomyces sp. PAL114 TaxID=2970893 RepID=UPI0039670D03